MVLFPLAPWINRTTICVVSENTFRINRVVVIRKPEILAQQLLWGKNGPAWFLEGESFPIAICILTWHAS